MPSKQALNQSADAGNEATDSINQLPPMGNIQNETDLLALLIELQATITQANASGTIPKKIGIDIRAALEKAIVEIEEPVPDKKNILDYLTAAKSLLDSIAGTDGLLSTIVTAIATVHYIL